MQVLCEGISSKVENKVTVADEPSDNEVPRASPFSAKAALKQTRNILASTGQTTRAVLSTVTDSRWWQGTVTKLTNQIERQQSHDMTNRNCGMEKQGCHPFYDGFIENCYSNIVRYFFVRRTFISFILKK